jgi:hypothetical protein
MAGEIVGFKRTRLTKVVREPWESADHPIETASWMRIWLNKLH